MRPASLAGVLALSLALSAWPAPDDKHGGHGSSGSGSGSSGSSGPGAGGSGPGCTVASGPGPAASAPQFVRRSLALTPTPTGASINAKGVAETRERGARQRFKIQVEAQVPDGVLFEVRVDGKPVGTITMRLGEGEFEVETNDGRTLPAGLNPVSGIKRVTVLNAGGVAVLDGSF